MSKPITYHEPPQASPLPKWVNKAYYYFGILIYVPDMLFNFYVFSDGSGLDTRNFSLTSLPGYILWGILSAGVVGTAYFCAIYATHNWAIGLHFKSFWCWVGLVFVMTITTWNSLSYRSNDFKSFNTDKWLDDVTHINGFSLTMVFVSIVTPVLGIFFAIVQPAAEKRSLADVEESHQEKLLKMRQQAEEKRLRAELNAGNNAARFAGMRQTFDAARAQVQGALKQEKLEEANETKPASEPAKPAPLAVVVPSDPNQTGAFHFADSGETSFPDSDEYPVAVGAEGFNPGASIQRLSERRPRGNNQFNQSRVQPMPSSRNGAGRNGKGR